MLVVVPKQGKDNDTTSLDAVVSVSESENDEVETQEDGSEESPECQNSHESSVGSEAQSENETEENCGQPSHLVSDAHPAKDIFEFMSDNDSDDEVDMARYLTFL